MTKSLKWRRNEYSLGAGQWELPGIDHQGFVEECANAKAFDNSTKRP